MAGATARRGLARRRGAELAAAFDGVGWHLRPADSPRQLHALFRQRAQPAAWTQHREHSANRVGGVGRGIGTRSGLRCAAVPRTVRSSLAR